MKADAASGVPLVKRGDKLYTVKSGEYSKYYSDHIALHIAKYLIDRILHKKNIATHLKPERNKVLSKILS